jgi:hypothetical protein
LSLNKRRSFLAAPLVFCYNTVVDDIRFAELIQLYGVSRDPILGYEIVQVLIAQGEEDFHKIMRDYDIPDIIVWDAVCGYSPGWTGELLTEITRKVRNRPGWDFLEWFDFSMCDSPLITSPKDLVRPLKFRCWFRAVWKFILDDIPDAGLDLFYEDAPRYWKYPALSLVSVPNIGPVSIYSPTVRIGIRSLKDVEPALDVLERIAYLTYMEEMRQDPGKMFFID